MPSFFDHWADVLVNYSTEVKPGDTVAISGGVAAEPLLRAIYRAVLKSGGLPVLVPSFTESQTDLFAVASDEQLQFISPLERWASLEAAVTIDVLASTNTRALSAVDPARQTIWNRARADLREIATQRAADGERRWTLTIVPTPAFAQDADMATDEFASFLAAACMLDRPDPVAAWRDLSARQARMIDWLESRRDIHITAPGTDVRLSVADRTWINSDGKRNFPSGEVFTGPVEDSAEGHIRFSFPVVTQGREIADIRLRFAAGAVVDATAGKNEEFLIASLDTDPGARRLGEFAFGTNDGIDRWTRNILLDEKMGGTVHMALGRAYPETGSANRSAIHWDLICDLRVGGEVTADGEVVLSDGRYRI
ncbi:MAG: peptidase aminopeptidase [Thermomicrobiales bacterium]|nr:peptidase aminopeptidase [Thermomicrobiales bacterium]